jgi:hypothetical protein
MKSRLAWPCLCAAALLTTAGVRSASAQAALDDDDDATAPEPTTESTSEEEDWGAKPHIGGGLRIRNVIVPEGLIELFVEDVPAGSSKLGWGLEVSRRKGNFEVQFAVERDLINIKNGYWVDKGDSIPADEPDFVYFDGNFGWWTAEVTFLNHSEIIPQLAIRYGGGAGIGIVTGDVRRDDAVCTSSDYDTCTHPYPGAENQNEPYSIPPVMLIVNAIVGVQIRPTKEIYINIEGGLRTIPFFGASAGYYF